jgi:hypothetical protein
MQKKIMTLILLVIFALPFAALAEVRCCVKNQCIIIPGFKYEDCFAYGGTATPMCELCDQSTKRGSNMQIPQNDPPYQSSIIKPTYPQE